ncbi:MAG: hypothetical protein DMG06_17325 [Acidobacteria bacterium]|nr:MAG: hypothetical protein DMG06_17325 [Acidobacteriota bacterium]
MLGAWHGNGLILEGEITKYDISEMRLPLSQPQIQKADPPVSHSASDKNYRFQPGSSKLDCITVFWIPMSQLDQIYFNWIRIGNHKRLLGWDEFEGNDRSNEPRRGEIL